MIDTKRIERIIRNTRSSAKFVSISHSSNFTEPMEIFGDGYFYVSLYDEQIDSVLNVTKDNVVYMIHNTYLPSFAYNLFLARLYQLKSSPDKSLANEKTKSLLKHNFKKFFAEQLLHFHNNIFSRAVFLETLLYEQQMMIPIFKATENDTELANKAGLSANLMSSIVSFHELGHFFLNKSSQSWDEMTGKFPATLGKLYSQIKDEYPPMFLEEFKCDAMSVFSCLSQYKEEESRQFLLKSLIFGFCSFAVMMSLVKSANATAEKHKTIADEVVFRSIEKSHRDYEYIIETDKEFEKRAELMIHLCKIIAEEDGCDLFAADEILPLPETILSDLLSVIDSIMDTDDENARAMSNLIAESLHDHPDGIEYLYLKSKVFQSKRQLEI